MKIPFQGNSLQEARGLKPSSSSHLWIRCELLICDKSKRNQHLNQNEISERKKEDGALET